MNTAQKNLVELKLKIPLDRQWEHDFLMGCIEAWEPYQDHLSSAYPRHRLRELEKKYGTTVAIITDKYKDS